MITRRTLAFWLALALCAATVLGAMSWLTRSVLAAEGERLAAQRDRASAEARADLEERTRLALWRMDALGAAMVLRENLVPEDFHRTPNPTRPAPAGGPEVLLRFQLAADKSLVTPPVAAAAPLDPAAGERVKRLQSLLAEHPPECFEWTLRQSKVMPRTGSPQWSGGAQPTPQLHNAIQRQSIPADQLRKDRVYQQSSNLNERSKRAQVVEQTVTSNQAPATDLALREAAPGAGELADDAGAVGGAKPAPATDAPAPEIAANQTADRDAVPPPTPAASPSSSPAPAAVPMPMVARSVAPKPAASRAAPEVETPATQAVKVTPRIVRAEDGRFVVDGVQVPTAADVGQMRAVWLGGELFLLRKVTTRVRDQDQGSFASWLAGILPATVVQGVWFDSTVLTTKLLQEVADLLPQARLVPATDESTAADPLALVSFPFKLERGELPLATAVATTPQLGAPLWVAWGAVALAVLTSALLVRGVLRLSERRASFVSAVTHELRTPLTTFRLYSDMLESGAVKEEKRGNYLRVLSREADRLSHLVENVLAFSRIERGNARSNVRETEVGELLESLRERFEARLATAGLKLVLPVAPALRVRADLAAVEHILFNLIDNAAKYAARGTPPEVEIRASAEGRWVAIAVLDHGPGIPVTERRRVFQAFHKSAREAAESQPGVGLGLALSRRLARAQGGELVIGERESGACFILRLPAAEGVEEQA
jgi:signal transduction histidine kinase